MDEAPTLPKGAAPGRLQHGNPARVLRRDLHRRVPPLHLLAVTAGAGLFRRVLAGPDGDSGESHLRLLQSERRDGISTRAGSGGRGQLRLRGLPDSHEHNGRGLHHRVHARHDGGLPKVPQERPKQRGLRAVSSSVGADALAGNPNVRRSADGRVRIWGGSS